MIEYSFKPMLRWPRESTPQGQRRAWPFKISSKRVGEQWIAGRRTPLSRTYEDLEKELRHLGVSGVVVIEVALEQKHIRLDGRPRADAPKPSHPGVILSFEAKIGGRRQPLKFMCDDCREWEDNLRAITLTLERLRLADLYGVTKQGEQYTGWSALPPPIVTPPPMTLEEAARFMAAVLHPDVYRKESEAWHCLQDAGNALKAHHGTA